jgi:anti-sigma B factor antagonist
MPLQGSEVEPFRCEVEPHRAAVWVRPIGELDMATAPVLDAQLGELWSVGFSRIALDLRQVRFLDSTGLHLLLSWDACSRADGFVLEIRPGPAPVQRVLELAGVLDRLTFWSPDGARAD